MLEAIVIATIATFTIGAGVSTFGPHQEPAVEKVAIVSERTGEVLYYNTK